VLESNSIHHEKTQSKPDILSIEACECLYPPLALWVVIGGSGYPKKFLKTSHQQTDMKERKICWHFDVHKIKTDV